MVLLLGLISKDISGVEHEYINIPPPQLYIFDCIADIFNGGGGGGGVCRANLPTSPAWCAFCGYDNFLPQRISQQIRLS